MHRYIHAYLAQHGLLLQNVAEERHLSDELVGHHAPQVRVRALAADVEPPTSRQNQSARLRVVPEVVVRVKFRGRQFLFLSFFQ